MFEVIFTGRQQSLLVDNDIPEAVTVKTANVEINTSKISIVATSLHSGHFKPDS